MGIRTNGIKTEYNKGEVHIECGPGALNSNAPQGNVNFQGDIKQKGNTRTLQITGNSQEVYNGTSGHTSEANVVFTGTPQGFGGVAQRAADSCLDPMRGLMLQPGTNVKDSPLAGLMSVDTGAVTSAMTDSSLNGVNTAHPSCKFLSDIPEYTQSWGQTFSQLSLNNVGYQSLCAGKLEAERQLMQKQITLERLAKQYGDLDFQSLLGGNIGKPSSEDVQGTEYNITRQRLYENYVPYLAQLLAAENNIS